MLSPLRYPGGKSDFAPTAFEIIKQCGLTGYPLVEPYAGSAAVSISLLDSGLISKATLVERDPLIYSFWRSLIEHTDELIERFLDTPITIKNWKKLRPLLAVENPTDKNLVDLGLAGLFFNRANFSGILHAGPIGGMNQASAYAIDCRTNKDELVVRMLSIATLANKLSVHFGDAIDVINKYKSRDDVLFYVDPPYFSKGELLYRHHYKIGEHKGLAKSLAQAKFPWFLSYDNHHVIEFLYEDFHIKRVKFQYSAHSPKNHEELVVSNFEIPFNPVVTRQSRS